MPQNVHTDSRRSRQPSEVKNICACVALAVGAVGSWFGLVHARTHGNYRALLWLGLLVVALAVGSMLCIALPLVRRIEAGATRRRATKTATAQAVGDYVAKYSVQDQVIAFVLLILFGCLTAFILLRSHRPLLQIALVAIFCGLIAYALQVTVTSVRFNNEGIRAQLPWSKSIAEPYTAIKRLQSKRGTIRIQFSDGRSLVLHSGLGNPDLVIGYLQAHCPESVELEDSPGGQG